MNNFENLLASVYQSFNRRAVDSVLAAMHPAVDRPNGWDVAA